MRRPPSRRAFLAAAGVTGLSALVAACGATPPPPAPPPPAGPLPPAAPGPTAAPSVPPGAWVGDGRSVALCAALSALAVEIYGEAASGAARGLYGTTPSVISTFLSTAGEQHDAHVETWNLVLAAAGAPEVSGVPLSIAEGARVRLAAARAPVELAVIAVDLETALVATVASALGSLTDPGAIEAAAGVAPVAAMRAATASFLSGRPPGATGDVPAAGPVPRALDPDVLTTG